MLSRHARTAHSLCFRGRAILQAFHHLKFSMTSALAEGSDDFWRDRSYKTRHIPNLPHGFRLRSANVTVTLDYARKKEMTSSLRKLMKDAAERADNVGSDEFDSERQKSFEEYSEAFVVRWSTNNTDLAAFILIGPSLYSSQYFDSCLVEVQVIRSGDVCDATFCDLVELAFELAKQLDIGYTVCLTAISSRCTSLVGFLKERANFEVLLTIPRSVNIGRGIGLTDNVLMSRNMQPAGYVRQPRATDEVLAMLSRHDIVDGPDDDATYNKTRLASSFLLPQQRTYDNGRLKINIRNVEPNDDRALYELMKASTQRGEGFSLHKYPNLASFRRLQLYESTFIGVIEDASNGIVIGASIGCSTTFARSPSAKCCRNTTIFHKDIQSLGIGKDVILLMESVLVHLGYETCVTTFASNNVRSRRLVDSGSDHKILGVFPTSGYLVGSGWLDYVAVYYARLGTGPQTKIIDAHL